MDLDGVVWMQTVTQNSSICSLEHTSLLFRTVKQWEQVHRVRPILIKDSSPAA